MTVSPKAMQRCGFAVASVFLALAASALSGRLSSAETPKATLPQKSGDRITVSPDQLHQIVVRPVEQCAFPVIKPGIGQIAFNEDVSSVVLTPFSGRVTKLLVKVGENVKRGDPLFELESPEVVQAQTDLIAAVHGLGKSRSQLALAKRTLDRQSSLIAGNATSIRDLDQAKADFAAAEADVKTALETIREAFAEEIESDAYGRDAAVAVDIAKRYMSFKQSKTA